jgi:phosphoglucomutase
MKLSPMAGKLAEPSILIDVSKLVAAYYTGRPDPSVPAQRVVFGTSGHRGCSLDNSFNEAHILAITQAICFYRKQQGVDGPLYIGFDTHALSEPAFKSALEVLAGNGIEVMVDAGNSYTPTPVISHAILSYNRDRKRGLADGIVITPSHNPPRFGGFKYDPPHGGPADTHVTDWIEQQANALIADGLRQVARLPLEHARTASTTHQHEYLNFYVHDLASVVDMQAIKESKVHIGVDPLGGTSVAYWDAIGDRYGLNLEVVNHTVDPTFRFMTVDWDGQIRMDPSSVYAMARMVGLKERFDVAFASDTDADRHGIVSHSQGLLDPNHYLSVAISYLFANRPQWSRKVAVGKTIVSSSMIDRVAADLNRRLIEVPVGFKWFVEGLIDLIDGTVGFCGEESSGATFLRCDGTVWTTDKDGLVPNLLAAEITARSGSDPGEHYRKLTEKFGNAHYERVDAPATAEQKEKLEKLSPKAVTASKLAGELITAKLTNAPGNQAPIGGLKVIAASGWFAARPSGTESIYKIYAESFKDRAHLDAILREAQEIVNNALEVKS